MAPSGEPKDSPKPQPLGSLPFLWLFTICTLCVFFLLWRRANSLRTVVSHQLKTWTRAEGQIRLSEDDGPPAHTFVEDSDNEDEDDADDGEPLAMRVERLRQERQRRLAAGVIAPTTNNKKDGSNSNGNTLTNPSQSFNNNLDSDPLLVSLTSSAAPLPTPTSKAPFSNTHTRSKTDTNANVGNYNTKNTTNNNTNNNNNNNNNNNSRNSTDGTRPGVPPRLIDTIPGTGVVNSSVSPQKSGVLTNCVDDPLSS